MALLTPVGLVAFLAGEWSVSRQINEDAEAFTGVARFVAEGPDLRWQETGRLRLGGYAGTASRAYRIVPAAAGWEVCFDDGRPFHALDLADGRCEARHLCGPDLYRGLYLIQDPDRLTVVWRVTGPGRADTIASDYRRAARMSASTRTSA